MRENVGYGTDLCDEVVLHFEMGEDFEVFESYLSTVVPVILFILLLLQYKVSTLCPMPTVYASLNLSPAGIC